MDINYIILSNSLPFEESSYSAQTPYKMVKLLPLGLVHSTKGDFLVDNESFQAIRCKFTERQLQIPIDYEHQTLKDILKEYLHAFVYAEIKVLVGMCAI